MSVPAACRSLNLKLVRKTKRRVVYRSEPQLEIIGFRKWHELPASWRPMWHGPKGPRMMRKQDFPRLRDLCEWITR